MSTILHNALHGGGQQQVQKSDAEYKQELNELVALIQSDFASAIEIATKERRRELIEAGQPMTVVIDSKVIELEVLKAKENAILNAAKLIVAAKRKEDMAYLFQVLRPTFTIFPKPRMAKITRLLIDYVALIPDSANLQIELCCSCIEWCTEEKRTFLRHRIQTKLAGLYQSLGRYTEGLELVTPLLKEVKQLDDKLLLVEVHLVEAKLYFSVRHIPKAKAALTAAKTNANAIHCPPLLQADMDLIAGSLHTEEKDFRTAYSYFYEAFEAFHLQNDERASQALQYMMLCRILSDTAENITNIGRGTTGLKYLEGPSIKCMIDIADAYAARSLENFEKALKNHENLIHQDIVLSRHVDQAAEQLLEQTISKMVEPYSEVEIAFIASKCELPVDRIQTKLSEMILDRKVAGTLDQGRGVFILFDQPPPRKIYEDSVEVFNELKKVIDLLAEKVHKVL